MHYLACKISLIMGAQGWQSYNPITAIDMCFTYPGWKSDGRMVPTIYRTQKPSIVGQGNLTKPIGDH